MLSTLTHSLVAQGVRQFGWLLALAGLILPAMQLYDWMT